jgi:hypothetical protein
MNAAAHFGTGGASGAFGAAHGGPSETSDGDVAAVRSGHCMRNAEMSAIRASSDGSREWRQKWRSSDGARERIAAHENDISKMKENLALLKLKSALQQPSPVPNTTATHKSRAITRLQAGVTDLRIPAAFRRVPHEALQSAVAGQQRPFRQPREHSNFKIGHKGERFQRLHAGEVRLALLRD